MGASLITGVVCAISLSAISVFALTLVQRSARHCNSAPGSSWKTSKLYCAPRKNNIMTIMSRCCIDAKSYTAESRCILESIIFPTSNWHFFSFLFLNNNSSHLLYTHPTIRYRFIESVYLWTKTKTLAVPPSQYGAFLWPPAVQPHGMSWSVWYNQMKTLWAARSISEPVTKHDCWRSYVHYQLSALPHPSQYTAFMRPLAVHPPQYELASQMLPDVSLMDCPVSYWKR